MAWLERLLADFRRRRGDLYGMNRRNIDLVYRHNRRRDYPLADDKLLAKQTLQAAGVAVAETLAVCDGLFAIPSTLERLDHEQDFVVKPANGSGGDGILVVGERLHSTQVELDRHFGPRGGELIETSWQRAGGGTVTREELHQHLAHIVFGAFSREAEDRAFVERRVRPHPVFQELWADGLCDVRVITVETVPTIAMVRVPTAMSHGRANLHQGGIGLAVDLPSGITFRAVHRRQPIERHPENGGRLIGIQLPDWSRLLEVAVRAAEAVPLGYLGVDLVVDVEHGPLVLEINARPGLEIQNVNGIGLGGALGRRGR